MYHPRPEVAAIISATVRVTNDMIRAMVAPENTDGRAAGRTTLLSMICSFRPRVLAELRMRWSMLKTPFTVPTNMGQNAPMNNTNTEALLNVGRSTMA